LLWGAPRLNIILVFPGSGLSARFFIWEDYMVVNEDNLFDKLNNWLTILHENIQWLLSNYWIYNQIKEIVKQNKNIQDNNVIFAWMSMVCLDSIVIGIRRQTDRRKGSISLIKLLENIKNNPRLISRRRYVAIYGPMREIHPGIKLDHGNNDFDKLVGEGKEFIDPAIPGSDIVSLREKAKKIEDYANKVIAHRDKSQFEYFPTHSEIQDCLDYLEALLKKYLLLFRAQSWDPIIPVFQFDWLRVLREPWIKE
jgi:hypothetical protein